MSELSIPRDCEGCPMISLAIADIRAARNQAEIHQPGPRIERPESAGPAPDQKARAVQELERRRSLASAEAGERALQSVLAGCKGRPASRGAANFSWLGGNANANTPKEPECGTSEQKWRTVETAMNNAYSQTR